MNFLGEVFSVIVNILTGHNNHEDAPAPSNNDESSAPDTSNGGSIEAPISYAGSFRSCISRDFPHIVGTGIIAGLFAFLLSYFGCFAASVSGGVLVCLGPAAITGVIICGVWIAVALLVAAINCLI